MINWIKITDQIPNTDRNILVYGEDFTMPIMGYYSDFHSSFIIHNELFTKEELTHWAELSDINLPEA